MRTGVFVGSFDPFTIGHEAIVNRALGLFDHLVIGVVGDNVHKQGMRPAEERMQCIADLYADNPAVEVKPYYGLAVEFAMQNPHTRASVPVWCANWHISVKTSLNFYLERNDNIPCGRH